MAMMHPKPLPPGPGQTSVWTFPRPARLVPNTRSLRVVLGGVVVAETRAGFMVIETSHPPTYYFPPDAITSGALTPTAGSSLCEWKGAARYFDVAGGGRIAARAAWSYPAPTDDFAAAADHVAFYARLMDACFVDGERVTPQEGAFYGGWITSHYSGPFKGPPGTQFW